jgi:hypothetical protein
VPERPVPAASNGAARRHRVEGGRPHAVKIRFTDAEFEAVSARAANAGVSVQRNLADRAFARGPAVRAPAALIAELAALRRLVGSLSNNINQIARWLNSGGRPDARVTGALDSVRRAMSRLDAVLAWLSAPQRATRPDSRSARAESPSASAERPREGGAVDPGQRNADPRAPA